jgi:hypothetical protein
MESEEPDIKSKQASKRDRTLLCHSPEINWLYKNLNLYLEKPKIYTWTILTQTHRENGNVKMIRIAEKIKITVEIQLPQ